MSERFKIVSPIDGSTYATLTQADETTVDAAVSRAHAVQRDWCRTDFGARAERCRRFVHAMEGKREEIAVELAWLMGRPVRFGPTEVTRLGERATHMIAIAERSLAPTEIASGDGVVRRIRRESLGVVLVIAPWNYPYLTAVNAIVPALMAGNAVILKHASQTSPCGDRFVAAFAEAGLPDGLFQHVRMSHASIDRIISQKKVDFVAFTGSVGAGGEVEHSAAGRFIGVALELGGKDPAYVRPDAPLEATAEALVDGVFFNSGQSCCAVERVYVHEAVYARFVDLFVDVTRATQKLGTPLDGNTTLGPVVSATAAAGIRSQIAAAVAAGAKPLLSMAEFVAATPDGPYVAPQILTGVHHGMSVMREETFGPVAGIMRVSSDEEAVGVMNDSNYGLTASVWTADLDKGLSLAERIETGTCFVNRCDYLDPALAWVGVKDSGRGCSLSSLGYAQLTRPKSYYGRVLL
ncbi:MAG TPA: aldehyde dehydrogenase family protein [bacterium]|nr:aldehyde dehydrogenase family protein [bacterium]